jgi:hypothetical protein
MGCWSIAGYLPSYYWYPFILLGQEKQVGLSVLLKDTEKQNATWPRFEPGISCSKVQHSATHAIIPLALHVISQHLALGSNMFV